MLNSHSYRYLGSRNHTFAFDEFDHDPVIQPWVGHRVLSPQHREMILLVVGYDKFPIETIHEEILDSSLRVLEANDNNPILAALAYEKMAGDLMGYIHAIARKAKRRKEGKK